MKLPAMRKSKGGEVSSDAAPLEGGEVAVPSLLARRRAGRSDAGRKAETQAQILDAAVELFARKGYDRTTIAAIAARAQVSRAAVFWHFGDKATLFQEALRRLLVPFVMEMAREAEHLEPHERVGELFKAFEAFTSKHQPVIERFVGWALESPGLRMALGPALINLHETFNHELAEAVEGLIGDREQALSLASGFLSLMDGNLLLDFVHPDPRARARRWEGLRLLARQALGGESGK